MKTQLIYNNITDLLLNRNWKKQEVKTKYDIFVPPSALGFSNTYKLYIYNKFENSDYEKEIEKNLKNFEKNFEKKIFIKNYPKSLKFIFLIINYLFSVHL